MIKTLNENSSTLFNALMYYSRYLYSIKIHFLLYSLIVAAVLNFQSGSFEVNDIHGIGCHGSVATNKGGAAQPVGY